MLGKHPFYQLSYVSRPEASLFSNMYFNFFYTFSFHLHVCGCVWVWAHECKFFTEARGIPSPLELEVQATQVWELGLKLPVLWRTVCALNH